LFSYIVIHERPYVIIVRGERKMKKAETKIGSERGQGRFKASFLKLFRADSDVHVSIVGQSEASQDSREEIRSVTFDADRARAVGLMEWQKSRRVSQVL